MSLLAHALAYAARGWPVFPCDPNDKRPLIKGPRKGEGGYKLASTDPEQIRRWWRSWPGAMIGVPTGQAVGAVVLDIDPKDGQTPEQVLREIRERVGAAMPPAPMTRTPRGGLHLWFAIPKDVHVGNRAGIIPGVDVRGDGSGYVIVPPSVRRGPKAAKDGCDGVAYAWVEDASLDDFEPAEADAAMLRFFTEKDSPAPRAGSGSSSPSAGTVARASRPAAPPPAEGDPRAEAVRRFALSAFDLETRKVAQAPQGQRNSTLNNAAIALGELVAAGVLGRAAVEAALEEAAAQSGLVKEDGLRGVRATIDSGMRKGLAQPRDLSQVGLKAQAGAQRRSSRRPEAPREGHATGSRGSRAVGKPAGGGDGGRGPVDYDVEFGPPTLPEWCSGQPQNDIGNGRRFLGRYGHRVMYVREVGEHVWSGTHWEREGGAQAFRRMAHLASEMIVQELAWIFPSPAETDAIAAAEPYRRNPPEKINSAIRSIMDMAEKAEERIGKRIEARRKFGITSGNSGRITAMLTEAMPHATVGPEVLDADPYAVNLLNGTLRFVAETVTEPDPDAPAHSEGMRTVTRWRARLDAHNPADRFAKIMPVAFDPAATCPRFLAFLARLQPHDDMRAFLRDYYGYALLGLTAVQAFVFHYGHGANGKSTFMELMAQLQGPYGRMLPAEALTGDGQRRSDQATPEFARLPGARMVRCAELPRGQGFRESTLKMLTGGEPILVRHLNEGFFEFKPIFKVTGSGNDKPSIGGVDEGIWRRMKLVPWEVTIPEAERRDMEIVLAEFMEEASGILNWLVEGALAYLHDGLSVPAEIRKATEDYRGDMDPVGSFLKACVEREPGSDVTARALYETFTAWCRENSVRPFSEKGFASIMAQKGYEKKELRIRKYCDIRIVYSPDGGEVNGQSSAGRWEREP